MDQERKTAIWNSYFDATMRSRYFLSLKDKLQRRLFYLSLAIAALSCGPLSNVFWAYSNGNLVASVTGGLAGVIGIYIATSDLTRKVGTATSAAIEWNQLSGKMERLYVKAKNSEDCWQEYLDTDQSAYSVDGLVISHLSEDKALLNNAYQNTCAELG